MGVLVALLVMRPTQPWVTDNWEPQYKIPTLTLGAFVPLLVLRALHKWYTCMTQQNICTHDIHKSRCCWLIATLVLALGRQRWADLFEFGDNLSTYTVSSRTARAERPSLKKQTSKQTKN